MSDGETTNREPTSVGVVAPDGDAGAVVEAVTDAGGVADAGGAAVATGVDVVVAVGATAVRDLAAAGVATLVLPVGVEGIGGVRFEHLRTAVERVLSGTYEVEERPLVRVETAAESTRVVFDVALSTVEPATISEFAVDALGERGTDGSSNGTRVARFRADGVVVATPVGSRGYARAAGGPVVVPTSDVLAVVPVAPFRTDPDHWVVPLSGVSLAVERDDAGVAVLTDGREFCTVGVGATVRLARDGALRVANVPGVVERE